MLTIDGGDHRFLQIRATGLLSSRDYRRFEAEFEREIQRRIPPVPLLLDMRGFRGWTPAALPRDLAWDIRNRKTFSKIAVVGDARWHDWSTYAGMLLFRARLKFFRSKEEAKQWLGVADARAPT
jgi:hypothetical protein